MLNMKLIHRETGEEVRMIGRLDNNSAADAEKILVDLVGRYDHLTLDMEQLEYISSAGLRALKRAHLAMRRKGGVLAAKNVGKMVMEVFEITGFAGMLKIV